SMLLSEDGRYRGYIAVADAIRQESQPVLAELHALGVEASVLLTGDNRAAATAIAQQAGIRDVRAELLPAQKVDAVKELLDQYDVTAMVGDGINDAPALAAASVGIAMGAGSAQALETADVALMGNELRKLPYALRLARAAMRTIRANIAFAIGIKLLFLGLVLFGLGNMWLAVLADVGASLLVTLNGTRLLRFGTQ
ncbi:MAG: HAD-IC family P-type ATPase, partial [Chlamydiia bacterium]|nr:HAD-IC family P-type ATPase [Chlamydiia bacterium]